MNCIGFGISTICKETGWGCSPIPEGMYKIKSMDTSAILIIIYITYADLDSEKVKSL